MAREDYKGEADTSYKKYIIFILKLLFSPAWSSASLVKLPFGFHFVFLVN